MNGFIDAFNHILDILIIILFNPFTLSIIIGYGLYSINKEQEEKEEEPQE